MKRTGNAVDGLFIQLFYKQLTKMACELSGNDLKAARELLKELGLKGLQEQIQGFDGIIGVIAPSKIEKIGDSVDLLFQTIFNTKLDKIQANMEETDDGPRWTFEFQVDKCPICSGIEVPSEYVQITGKSENQSDKYGCLLTALLESFSSKVLSLKRKAIGPWKCMITEKECLMSGSESLQIVALFTPD